MSQEITLEEWKRIKSEDKRQLRKGRFFCLHDWEKVEDGKEFMVKYPYGVREHGLDPRYRCIECGKENRW
ncbi:MAG: hypothetical protein HXX80_06925 [Nitrososphaerales archaeon]|nr:hypothetical protein [Nitrososphaerales archaeon]